MCNQTFNLSEIIMKQKETHNIFCIFCGSDKINEKTTSKVTRFA